MVHYPLVSLVIIGSSDLIRLQNGFNAIQQIRYPKDQLELFLIMPPQRPVPFEALEGRMAAKVVQFDTGLPWDEQEARWEGMNLATGEFVQILSGFLALHPDWLQKALPYFLHHQVFGVRGKITSATGAVHGQGSPRLRSGNRHVPLEDGLYDRKVIHYLKLKKELITRSMENYFPVPQKILDLPIEMATEAVEEATTQTRSRTWQSSFRKLVQKIAPNWLM